jgi:hypothetical protein
MVKLSMDGAMNVEDRLEIWVQSINKEQIMTDRDLK